MRNLVNERNLIITKKDDIRSFFELGSVSFERYENPTFPCQFTFLVYVEIFF